MTKMPEIKPIVKSDINEAKIVTTIMVAIGHMLQVLESKIKDDEEKMNEFREHALRTMHCILPVIASYSIQTYLECDQQQAQKIRGYSLYAFMRGVDDALYSNLKLKGMTESPKEILTHFMNKNMEREPDTDSKEELENIIDEIKASMDSLKKQCEKQEEQNTAEKKPKKKKKKEE